MGSREDASCGDPLVLGSVKIGRTSLEAVVVEEIAGMVVI